MRNWVFALALAAALLTALVSASFAYAASPSCPVQGIIPVQGFPSPIVAGSKYTVRYRFNNTASEAVTVFVNMNVSNSKHPVNLNEFLVSMWINSNKLNCSEKKPGSFYCYNKTSEYSLAKKSGNELYVNFSSVPNLYPDKNYTFALDILTQNPLINVLFADGSGEFRVSGRTVSGQARIYVDSQKHYAKFWIKDRRTQQEYSRSYDAISYSRTWFGESYYFRNELGQTLGITVFFNTIVYASGTDVSFQGWKA